MPYRITQRALIALLLIPSFISGCQTNSSSPGNTDNNAPQAKRAQTPSDSSQIIEQDKPVPDADALLAFDNISPALELQQNTNTSPDISKRAQKLVDNALKLKTQQRYTEASMSLEQALRLTPNHPELQRELAGIHYAAGNLERAKRYIEQAIEADATSPNAHLLAGQIAILFEDRDNALLEFRTALAYLNQSAAVDADKTGMEFTIKQHLASLLHDMGFYTASIEQLNWLKQNRDKADAASDALVIRTHAENQSLLADNYENLGQYSRAADALQEAMAASTTTDDELTGRYAQLLLRAGRTEDAITQAKSLGMTEENLPLVRKIFLDAGKKNQYASLLKEKISGNLSNDEFVLLAGELLPLNSSDEIVSIIQQKLQGQPGNDQLNQLLFDVYAERENWQSLYAITAGAINKKPGSANLWKEKFLSVVNNEFQPDGVSDPTMENTPGDAFLRASLFLHRGDTEKAQNTLESIYQTHKEFVPVRVLLSKIFLDKYDYQRAIEIAQRTDPENVDDMQLEFILGRCYYALDDVTNAQKHLRATLQDDEFITRARLLLGKMYSLTNKNNMAQQHLRALLKLQPENEEAVEILAAVYLETGKFNDTIALYEELEKNTESPAVKARCRAILQQFSQPNPETYRQVILDDMNTNKPDALSWIVVGESYELQKAQDRVDAFEKALALDNNNLRALLGLARAYQGILAFDKSSQTWEQLLRIHPNRHSWRLAPDGLVTMYQVQEQFDKAIKMITEQTDRSDLSENTTRQYRQACISTLLYADRKDESIRIVNEWLTAQPTKTHWKRWLAGLYVEFEQHDKAIPLLQEIVSNDPANVSAMELLLESLIAAGQEVKAEQMVLEKLYNDPTSDEASRLLIYVLDQSKKHKQAREIARNKLEVTSNQLYFEDLLVTLYSRERDYESAIELLETYITRYSQNRQDEPIVQAFRDRIVELLFLKEDFEEADRRIRFWLSMPSDNVTYNHWLQRLSFCQDMLGNYDESTKLKQQYLQMSPNDVVMNNDLAYNWINRGVQLEQAEPLIQFAVSQSPLQSAYLDTFGWLKYKQNQMDEAVLWLGRAHRLQTRKDAVIADHYGDALWRVGQKDKALQMWEKAMDLIDDSEFNIPTRDEVKILNNTPRKIEAAKNNSNPTLEPLASKQENENPE